MYGTGILTCFPFDVLELGFALGPTNPQLTNIAEEPLPLRWMGFSPTMLLLLPEFLFLQGPLDLTTQASTHAGHLPTRLPFGAPWYR